MEGKQRTESCPPWPPPLLAGAPHCRGSDLTADRGAAAMPRGPCHGGPTRGELGLRSRAGASPRENRRHQDTFAGVVGFGWAGGGVGGSGQVSGSLRAADPVSPVSPRCQAPTMTQGSPNISVFFFGAQLGDVFGGVPKASQAFRPETIVGALPGPRLVAEAAELRAELEAQSGRQASMVRSHASALILDQGPGMARGWMAGQRRQGRMNVQMMGHLFSSVFSLFSQDPRVLIAGHLHEVETGFHLTPYFFGGGGGIRQGARMEVGAGVWVGSG